MNKCPICKEIKGNMFTGIKCYVCGWRQIKGSKKGKN